MIKDHLYIKYFLLLSFSFLMGCGLNELHFEKVGSNNEEQKVIEDFEEFYEKFHADSLFQFARVRFPLEGYNYSQDYDPVNEDDEFLWVKSDWDVHRKPIPSEFLKVEYNRQENRIEEIVSVPNSGIRIIRRFGIVDKKWHLIFYGNQNL